MVHKDGHFILQEGRSSLCFHSRKLLQSESNVNDMCRGLGKTYNREMGPVCIPGSKSIMEESDFADTMRNEELVNYDNCMWLSSSDALSPSTCYLQLFSYMDLIIDTWYISLLSTPSKKSGTLLSTKVTFFDGSRLNPIEEASLVLDQQNDLDENVAFQENSDEKEVVSWLLTCTNNEPNLEYFENDFTTPISVSSITDSSDEHSSFSSSSNSDYSSDVVDLEEFGTDKPLFWPFNWEFDCGSETNLDFFIMSPRKVFASSVYRDDDITESESSDLASKIKDFEDTRTKTPIFWPTSFASEWGPDTKWDLLTMSPRKDIYKFGISPKTFSDNLRRRIIGENMDVEKGCNRRLEFSNNLKNTKTLSIEKTEDEAFTKIRTHKHKIVLEDLLLVDKLNVDGSIEDVLGLCEFDGREGIDS